MSNIVTPTQPRGRTLTAVCVFGLCNRLKVLLSGRVLAAETGREFKMLWPLNSHCGATFRDLFEDGEDVCDLNGELPAYLPPVQNWEDPFPDILSLPDRDVVVNCGFSLLRAVLYPAHAPLRWRCGRMLDAMRPATIVRETVERFVADRFRPAMIGVHVRRGEFMRDAEGKHNPFEDVFPAVDTAIKALPEAGILLCTDDGAPVPDADGSAPKREGVKEKFAQLYGRRVVWYEPREVDRGKPAAIQDALVDFLLLRKTSYVVGTKGSSFSRLAAFGRRVPFIVCGKRPPWYRE